MPVTTLGPEGPSFCGSRRGIPVSGDCGRRLPSLNAGLRQRGGLRPDCPPRFRQPPIPSIADKPGGQHLREALPNRRGGVAGKVTDRAAHWPFAFGLEGGDGAERATVGVAQVHCRSIIRA